MGNCVFDFDTFCKSLPLHFASKMALPKCILASGNGIAFCFAKCLHHCLTIKHGTFGTIVDRMGEREVENVSSKKTAQLS